MKNEPKEMQQTDTLLTVTMTLLNIAVVLTIGATIWLVHSLVQNSTVISKLINGSFLP